MRGMTKYLPHIAIGGIIAAILAFGFGFFSCQAKALNSCRENLGTEKANIESLEARIRSQNAKIEKNAEHTTKLLKAAEKRSNEARRNTIPLPDGMGADVMNELERELL